MQKFSSTGVFPYDRTKYDESRLSRSKVEAYNRWILSGRPENEEGIPVVAPAKEKVTEMVIIHNATMPSDSRFPLPTETNPSPGPQSLITQFHHLKIHQKVYQHSRSCCLHLHSLQELAVAIGKVVQTKKSMEQIISDRKCPHEAKKPGARRVLGKGASVLTHEEVISSIEERENAKKQKEDQRKQKAENRRSREAEKKKQKGKKKTTTQKRGRKKAASNDDYSSSISAGSYSVDSRGSSLDVSLGRISKVRDDEDGAEVTGETDVERSKSTEDRDEVISVKIDDDSVNRYSAVIYTDPKKQYYWGKVTKVFSDDEELPVNKVEMMFLHHKTLSSMPEKITWHWPPEEDKHVADIEYIFMGPCSPDLLKNGSYKFDDVKANEFMKKV